MVSAKEERESKSWLGSALRKEEASRTREGLGKGLACGVTGPGWQMAASRLLDSSALASAQSSDALPEPCVGGNVGGVGSGESGLFVNLFGRWYPLFSN